VKSECGPAAPDTVHRVSDRGLGRVLAVECLKRASTEAFEGVPVEMRPRVPSPPPSPSARLLDRPGPSLRAWSAPFGPLPRRRPADPRTRPGQGCPSVGRCVYRARPTVPRSHRPRCGRTHTPATGLPDPAPRAVTVGARGVNQSGLPP